MKKLKFLQRVVTVLVSVMLMCSVVGIADVGTDEDPLISLSYYTDVLYPQIQEYVKELISENKGEEGEEGVHTAASFEVVSLKSGEKLIAEAGTELILRMGSGTIISTEKGGIVDSTAGVDLPNGSKMPPNHLLIVPLDDGRGFTANESVLVMVKGGYTILN